MLTESGLSRSNQRFIWLVVVPPKKNKKRKEKGGYPSPSVSSHRGPNLNRANKRYQPSANMLDRTSNRVHVRYFKTPIIPMLCGIAPDKRFIVKDPNTLAGSWFLGRGSIHASFPFYTLKRKDLQYCKPIWSAKWFVDVELHHFGSNQHQHPYGCGSRIDTPKMEP